MVQVLRWFAFSIAGAASLCAPPMMPRVGPVQRPTGPFSGATPQMIGANAGSQATSLGIATQSAPRLRGNPAAALLPAAPSHVEANLMKILTSTSPTIAAMNYESEVLRLPVLPDGNPSVPALLDSLEAATPPTASFDKQALVGQWSLEYSTDLPGAVRDELQLHVKDEAIADLAVMLSISDNGAMVTTAEISLRNGEKRVVTLHDLIAQQGLSPRFSMSGQDGKSSLGEVTYASKDMILLRRDLECDDTGSMKYASPKTDVLKRIERRSDVTKSMPGRAALWRFGLYDGELDHSIIPNMFQAPLRTASKSQFTSNGFALLGGVLLTTFIALGRHWWRGFSKSGGVSTVPDTSLQLVAVDAASDEKFAVAGFTGQTVEANGRSQDARTPMNFFWDPEAEERERKRKAEEEAKKKAEEEAKKRSELVRKFGPAAAVAALGAVFLSGGTSDTNDKKQASSSAAKPGAKSSGTEKPAKEEDPRAKEAKRKERTALQKREEMQKKKDEAKRKVKEEAEKKEKERLAKEAKKKQDKEKQAKADEEFKKKARAEKAKRDKEDKREFPLTPLLLAGGAYAFTRRKDITDSEVIKRLSKGSVPKAAGGEEVSSPTSSEEKVAKEATSSEEKVAKETTSSEEKVAKETTASEGKVAEEKAKGAAADKK